MMNINFVFNVVVSLSFVSRFNVTIDERQDYFIFNGNDTTAHLSRSNKTVRLVLLSGNNYELYQTYNVTNNFTFKWNGFIIDDQEMYCVNSSGKIDQIQFDSFSFLSPYLELEKEEFEFCSCEQAVFNCEDINYGFIALIMFGIGIGLRSDAMVMRIWKQITSGYKLVDINELPTIEEEEEKEI